MDINSFDPPALIEADHDIDDLSVQQQHKLQQNQQHRQHQHHLREERQASPPQSACNFAAMSNASTKQPEMKVRTVIDTLTTAFEAADDTTTAFIQDACSPQLYRHAEKQRAGDLLFEAHASPVKPLSPCNRQNNRQLHSDESDTSLIETTAMDTTTEVTPMPSNKSSNRLAAAKCEPHRSTTESNRFASTSNTATSNAALELSHRFPTSVHGYSLDFERVLGRGTFSQVLQAFKPISECDVEENDHDRSDPPSAVAVKAISLCPENVLGYKNELKILRLCQGHANIVSFHTHQLHGDNCFILLELCQGDVFDRVTPGEGVQPREHASNYFMQLMAAVTHIHGLGICHLDIKPENMLLDERGLVKLCDFGLSCLCEDGPVYGSRGSYGYAAPENIRSRFSRRLGRYSHGYDGQRADIWSCGVVLFVLMFGATPWDVAKETSTEYRMYRATGGWPNIHPWNTLSSPLRQLLQRMLGVQPNHRWTAQQIGDYCRSFLGWNEELAGHSLNA